jgi:uncharacterized protein YdaU (DUF1376 family)
MATDPYYPFYPGDYIRDTQDLSLTEHGAYRIMLDHYYCEETLPSDKQRLYRLCRAFTDEERKAVDNVAARFFIQNNGCLINNRAEIELQRRREFLKRQSEKGKLSAAKRGNKINHGSTAVQPAFEPDTQPESNLSSPSPSPSLSPSPSPSIKSGIKDIPDCPQQKIVDLWHEVLPELPKIKIWAGEREVHLRARWREDEKRQTLK